LQTLLPALGGDDLGPVEQEAEPKADDYEATMVCPLRQRERAPQTP